MSKPEFVYVTYIETTPENLWEALTNSEFTKQYWFDTEVRSDWKVGSPFALVMSGKTTDTGEILEAEPATKVVFTIEPYGNLVKLTVTHEGFVEGSKLLDSISRGWPAILSGLKSLLETGKAFAIPPVALGIQGFE